MEQEPYRVDARVELTKAAGARAGIDWPAWIQAISPILSPSSALYFTDTVREGFERQQLQLANAAGMQGLLVQLLGADVSQIEAHAAASTLASFGAPASPRWSPRSPMPTISGRRRSRAPCEPSA